MPSIIDFNTASGQDCRNCDVKGRSEWNALDSNELETFSRLRIHRKFNAGDPIFLEGEACEGIYCLEKGLVGIRKSDPNGSSFMLRLSYPGDTLGYRAFVSDDFHETTAEALEPSSMCFIPKSPLKKLMHKNPSLCFRFLEHAARDLKTADECALQLSSYPVPSRLIHILVTLGRFFGASDNDGALFLTLPITKADLASLIHTRPETLSRAIRKLENDNIVSFSGRTVRLTNVGPHLRNSHGHESPG